MPKRPKRDAATLDDRSEMGLAIGAYLEHLAVSGRSERTVITRRAQLLRFAAWCREREVVRPDAVTRPVLLRYQRHLFYLRDERGMPLSLKSQHELLTALCVWFRWLTRSNRIAANPAADLERPRYPRQLPADVLSAGEADRLVSMPDLTSPLGVRDRAILELFYATGVRRCELARLTVFDLDLERVLVVVRHGKGGKQRVVPLGERAAAWLDKYLREVRPKLAPANDDGSLFLTYEGLPFALDSLSQMVKHYLTAAGIERRGACHLLRHTMATAMLDGGADVRFVQEMLGHAKIETTQIYTHVSIRKLQEIHRATHPGARLGRQVLPDDEQDA